MTDDAGDQHANEKVQDVFVVHRQRLHQALKNSADSMHQALMDQQKMYAQFSQGLPAHLHPNDVVREGDPMEPITRDFIGKAYSRAREMFEELERQMNEAQSGSSSPRSGLPEQDERTDQAIEDSHTATDLMMSQATSHLSAAMKTMVAAMDNRLSAPVPGIDLYDAATRLQNRS